MPPVFPVLSGREVVCIFALGWQVARHGGSHTVNVKEGEMATLSVPIIGEVAKGTLQSLIRAAGLTVAEFVAAV